MGGGVIVGVRGEDSEDLQIKNKNKINVNILTENNHPHHYEKKLIQVAF